MPELCGDCGVDLTRKKSILCVSCQMWFHLECQNISKELFSILDKNRKLSFHCKECVLNPPQTENDSFKREIRKEFAALKSQGEKMNAKQEEMNFKINTFVEEIRREMSVNLKKVNDDILNCNKQIENNEIAAKKKFNEMEIVYHMVQHSLNRSHIIVSGLSKNITNLNECAVKIGTFLGVEIAQEDIEDTFYIRNKNAILIKFKKVVVRDKVMSAYSKVKNLKKSDVEGGNEVARIYLNDNYAPLAYKLFTMCSKLKREKRIEYFTLINRDIPKCKIKMLNDSFVVVDIHKCVEMFQLDA